MRIAVFASGGGTNLQALIDYFEPAGSTARVALVISDRPDAGALERARRAGIQSCVIPVKGRAAEDVARETLDRLDNERIDIVALAGYLRLVPETVVRRYRGRIVNIHPALLPAFGGAGMYGGRVHRAVIESGCLVTGVTVHYVDERYDEGRALIQWPVPVLEGDDAETLGARVLRIEHILYPLALEALARSLAAHDSHEDAEKPEAGVADPSGFRAGDPAAFEWTTGDDIGNTVRRLLGIEG